MSEIESEEYVGVTHQELQVYVYLNKYGVKFEHNSNSIPELKESNLYFKPDFLIRGTPNIIIEIDEDSHKHYDIHNEVKRMIDIWNAFNKDLIFIRVSVDRTKTLRKDQLDKIYTRIDEYKDYKPSNRLLVDQIFYPESERAKFTYYKHIKCSWLNDDYDDYDDYGDSVVEEKPIIVNKDKDKDKEIPVDLMIYKYTCKRCAYNTHVKGNIKTHLSRKKPCKAVYSSIPNEKQLEELYSPRPDACFQCGFCDKRYVDNRNRLAHEEKCDKKASCIKKLEDRVRELSNTKVKKSNKPTMIINSIDEPSIEHIEHDSFLRSLCNDNTLEDLIKMVYFDPNVPENHSIHAPSTSTTDLMVSNGKSIRKSRYPDKSINKIISVLIKIQKTYLDEYQNELDAIIKEIHPLLSKDDLDIIMKQISLKLESALNDPNLVGTCMSIFNANYHIIKS